MINVTYMKITISNSGHQCFVSTAMKQFTTTL